MAVRTARRRDRVAQPDVINSVTGSAATTCDAYRVVAASPLPEATPEVVARVQALIGAVRRQGAASAYGGAAIGGGIGRRRLPARSRPSTPAQYADACRRRPAACAARRSACGRRTSAALRSVTLAAGKRQRHAPSAGKRAHARAQEPRRTRVTLTVSLNDGRTATQTLHVPPLRLSRRVGNTTAVVKSTLARRPNART